MLGTRRSTWENNKKMHLKELGYVIVKLFEGDSCQQLWTERRILSFYKKLEIDAYPLSWTFSYLTYMF
jgi:hypothetical protein